MATYVPCEQLGTPLYYGTLNVQNGFFGILTRQQPFESILPLMKQMDLVHWSTF